MRAAQDKTIAKPLSEGEAACLKQANKEAGKANKVEPRKDIFVLKRNRLRAFFVSVLFPTLVVT